VKVNGKFNLTWVFDGNTRIDVEDVRLDGDTEAYLQNMNYLINNKSVVRRNEKRKGFRHF
jgi:hypothetical protein